MKRLALILGLVWASAGASADLSSKQAQAVFPVYVDGRWSGSGFFAGRYFYTAGHVAEIGAMTVAGYPVRVIHHGYAQYEDYAVCKVDGFTPPAKLKWAKSGANGMPVAAYGYQNSGLLHTTGEIVRWRADWRAGASSAQIKGGYSGGPIIHRETNEVLGILTNNYSWSNRAYGNSKFTRTDMVPK